jgi:hypothetical protein
MSGGAKRLRRGNGPPGDDVGEHRQSSGNQGSARRHSIAAGIALFDWITAEFECTAMRSFDELRV